MRNPDVRRRMFRKMIAIFFIMIVLQCMPYVKIARKKNLVRIALVSGAQQVAVSGILKKKHIQDHVITKDATFPIYVSARNDLVGVNGKTYRGNLELHNHGGRIWIINVLSMEDYLKGVVPCEIGKISRALFEAAKAQAVAARTYAYAHLNQYAALEFDLYASVRDQVYSGVQSETELTDRAVKETQGFILTYEQRLIEAKYHSTCGGSTADFNDAWPGTPPPYLKSVRCPYCQSSPHYTWQRKHLKNDFFAHLRSRLDDIEESIPEEELIRNIKLIRNRRSKRILEVVIITAENEYSIPGYQVRKLFGDDQDPGGLLKSNYITFDVRADTIIIKGKGFGHGVGMCQFGAIEMARQGKDFKEILSHYYTGTRISKAR